MLFLLPARPLGFIHIPYLSLHGLLAPPPPRKELAFDPFYKYPAEIQWPPQGCLGSDHSTWYSKLGLNGASKLLAREGRWLLRFGGSLC